MTKKEINAIINSPDMMSILNKMHESAMNDESKTVYELTEEQKRRNRMSNEFLVYLKDALYATR